MKQNKRNEKKEMKCNFSFQNRKKKTLRKKISQLQQKELKKSKNAKIEKDKEK